MKNLFIRYVNKYMKKTKTAWINKIKDTEQHQQWIILSIVILSGPYFQPVPGVVSQRNIKNELNIVHFHVRSEMVITQQIDNLRFNR